MSKPHDDFRGEILFSLLQQADKAIRDAITNTRTRISNPKVYGDPREPLRAIEQAWRFFNDALSGGDRDCAILKRHLVEMRERFKNRRI
jgi:hypothetical protein